MKQAFKEDELVIKPKQKVPQEIEPREDVQGESELVRDIVRETKSFEDDLNAYEVACQQDLCDL